jgi:pimeloyl-ACP methyl ester carboxylesterase
VRRGHGEPLVLIHPLGAELVVWEPVLGRLARDRDVIALDLPGFGASPPLDGDASPSPRALAGAVAEFLGQLGIARAHLAGNSLGGWVALELAKTGHALSVAPLCSAGFWSRPLGPRARRDLRGVGRGLLPLLPVLLRSAAGRRLLLRDAVGHPDRVPPDAAARLVRSYLTAPGYDGANAEMRAATFTGVEDIRVPVTLIWAELDRLVRRPDGTVEDWRTVLLRGCGHIPTWDDPGQVARALLLASA